MSRKNEKRLATSNPENGVMSSLRDRAPKLLGVVAEHVMRTPNRIATKVQLHIATTEHRHNKRKFQQEQVRLDSEIDHGQDTISDLNAALVEELQNPKLNKARIRALIGKLTEYGMGGITSMGDTIIAAAQAPEGLSGVAQEAIAMAINENWEEIKSRDPLLTSVDLTNGNIRDPIPITPEQLASIGPQRIRELIERGSITQQVIDIATASGVLARMNMSQIDALGQVPKSHANA